MKIQGVNGVNNINNNPSFGTKVLVRPAVKETIEKSKAKKEIYMQIENLKKNGVKDFLVLGCSKNGNKGEVSISAEVVEFANDKCYRNIFPQNSVFKNEQKSDKINFWDINSTYDLLKDNMVEVGSVTKNILDTLLHEYQEL
jgi:hypothetical protein